MKKEDLKVSLSITICFLVVIMGMIWLSSESRSNQKVKVINKTKQTITDPVSKMEKRLGPSWKKIEMVQGKWYGPYSIKNGTKWRIATGGITVKLNGKDNETYQEFPNSKIKLTYGKKVAFSSTKKGTVMFFKY
jgi:hypothetical protein